jgi:methionyl-tRNA formyltransferase
LTSRLTIGYLGHGPWAHRALERILADPNFQILFVATRVIGDDTLKQLAGTVGLPYFTPGSINSEEWRERLLGFGADLLVSMSFDQIFRRPLLDTPRLGMINCHAGALPYYRGRNILNWALINGESSFGVTVHRVVEGVDAGDILRQDIHPIGPDETYAELRARAYEACAESLHAALRELHEGRAVFRSQAVIHPVGFYCGRRRDGDEWIDWRLPEKRVHDFVRGISAPELYARARLDGRVVRIARTRRIVGAPHYVGTPGEVVGRGTLGFVVKTGDSTIEVIQAWMSESADVVDMPRLPIGTRFEPYVDARLLALEAHSRGKPAT